nr:hypothetical protein [Tanacetum cinerariifolium]
MHLILIGWSGARSREPMREFLPRLRDRAHESTAAIFSLPSDVLPSLFLQDIRPSLITNFSLGQCTFAYPYLTETFDKVLWDRLHRHTFEAHTFPEPILYLVGLADSWEHDLSIPFILVDEEDGFPKLHEKVWPDSYFLCLELAVVGEGCSDQNVVVVEGSKKRRSITEALEEEATVVRPMSKKKKNDGPRRMSARGNVPRPPPAASKGVSKHSQVLARYIRNFVESLDFIAPNVKETHAAHNMLFDLHYPLLRDKLGYLSFDELVNVYDVHALQMELVKAQKNQDVEGSQVVKDLRSENAHYLEELSMLQRVVVSVEESRKQISEELDGLQPCLKEAERLAQFKKFLPVVIKKPFGSEHFIQDLRDLQQKAITFDRSQDLDEVHGFGDS